MANGIDRLEKLFSKRKASTASAPVADRSTTMAVSPIDRGLSGSPIPHFPQPSFMRPISSRMVARDEVSRVPRVTGRSQSLPEPPQHGVRVLPPQYHATTTSSYGRVEAALPEIPDRTSSLFARRDASLRLLAGFQFPQPPGHSPSTSQSSSVSASPTTPTPRRKLRLNKVQPLAPLLLRPGLETPPLSDPDDSIHSPDSGHFTKSFTAILPPPTELTPEPSPDMLPSSDSLLDQPEHVEFLDTRPLLKRSSTDDLAEQPSSAHHMASHPVTPRRLSLEIPQSPILQEPDYAEFLSLSDDDILETRPHTPDNPRQCSQSPITPPSLFTPRSLRARPPPSSPPPFAAPRVPLAFAPAFSLPTPSLSRDPPLNLSGSALDRDASAKAAIQIAHIASRYRFDLAYVVNLSPRHVLGLPGTSTRPSESPPTTPTPSRRSRDSNMSIQSALVKKGNIADMGPHSALQARYLAAYGLADIKAPFSLSASLHAKILNTDRWVKPDLSRTNLNEFGRAYGCSYHADAAPVARRGSIGDCDADSESDERSGSLALGKRPAKGVRGGYANNCGVVFVAYRKTANHGNSLDSHPSELEALHRDVEHLVESILDFHLLQRRQEQLAALRSALEVNGSADIPATNSILRSPRRPAPSDR